MKLEVNISKEDAKYLIIFLEGRVATFDYLKGCDLANEETRLVGARLSRSFAQIAKSLREALL